MNSEAELLTDDLLLQLNEKGVSKELVLSQIETFRKGIPYTELVRPCTLGDGIENIDESIDKYLSIFENETGSLKVIKFVPASGAASRMFKELLSVSGRDDEVSRDSLEKENSKESQTFIEFIDDLSKFAFVDTLKKLIDQNGFNLDELLEEPRYKVIADYTLGPVGLNYANLPKGIIEFHKYEDKTRTAFEEHLVEATQYSTDSEGISRLHFTVSPEHLNKVKGLIDSKLSDYTSTNQEFEIAYSVQKPSTDTIAVDMENKPLFDSNGKVVLRPGGHGALIENLNELNCDIAFIKNIDNVVPDYLKVDTYIYKKALAGYLISLQQKSFAFLKFLDDGASGSEFIDEVLNFLAQEMKIDIASNVKTKSIEEQLAYIRKKLDRPIRICGVVKNLGEPGGGPFWIADKSGNLSKQIIESAQVNQDSDPQRKIWESSTHFNPVDLVCGLKDYRGQKYDLKKYVDPDAGFISHKSKDGVDLKALELPGLWNGAMADWNTLFVEVPVITFNPVKTILDLLRPEHQPQAIIK